MPDLTHDVADIPSPSGTELALEEAKRRIAELVNPNIAHSDWLIAAARGRTFISNAPEREDILFITIKVSEVANLKRRVRALEAALRGMRDDAPPKMKAADIGCVEYECQSGKGDPPMDCIYPDCPCGIYLAPEYSALKDPS